MSHSTFFPPPVHLYEMTGKDARDFLHRLTTANVRDLEPGRLASGFFLNPQGKARAGFRIAARGEESFYLEVEGGEDSQWRDALLAVMDQFTFAEKYELRELSSKGGLRTAWLFGDDHPENTFEELGSGDSKILLFHGDKHAYGEGWTSAWARDADLERTVAEHGGNRIEETEFNRRRILAMAPRLGFELLPESNPLELGLRNTIADNKGCYPGQEVIEKIISLGSPAKRLALLTGNAAVPPLGASVRLGDSEVGTITSSTDTHDHGFAALAILRKNAAVSGKTLQIATPGAPIDAVVEKLALYE